MSEAGGKKYGGTVVLSDEMVKDLRRAQEAHQRMVEPNLKPDPEPCGCGCGVIGRLRVRPWRDGTVCVKVGCTCNRCRGKRSSRKGDAKARVARKALGIPGANTRHEELWAGTVRSEMKAGAQIKPAVTAFLRMEAQSEAQRPMGDNRPFVGVAMPDGSKDGVVMFRLSKLVDVVAAFAEQWESA